MGGFQWEPADRPHTTNKLDTLQEVVGVIEKNQPRCTGRKQGIGVIFRSGSQGRLLRRGDNGPGATVMSEEKALQGEEEGVRRSDRSEQRGGRER